MAPENLEQRLVRSAVLEYADSGAPLTVNHDGTQGVSVLLDDPEFFHALLDDLKTGPAGRVDD